MRFASLEWLTATTDIISRLVRGFESSDVIQNLFFEKKKKNTSEESLTLATVFRL